VNEVTRRLTRVAVVTIATLLLVAPAFAQRAPRSASAEAFSFCREQEKAGDARACWSVWLQKYRSAGSEAELAYAEANPTRGAGTSTARLQLTSTPSADVTLDGRRLGMTPRDGVEVSPGEHRITFANRSRTEGRTITVVAGESRVVDVQFDAKPVAPVPTSEAPTTRPPSGEILDFCALSPAKGARKERVILFSPSGTARVNNNAELRAFDGARLVREVFTARFALERFHNVLSSFPAKKGWEERESLTLAEVRVFLRDTPEQPEGTADYESRVEREKRFISYSVGCADYIAIPTITSHETKWETSKLTPPDAATPPKFLSFAMNGSLGIFRRKGDRFERIARLSASVPSFEVASSRGVATELDDAGVDSLSPPRVRSLPTYVSGVPDPKCLTGKTAAEGVAGLAACGPTGEGTVEQALGSFDERLGAACARSRDASTPDSERLTSSVQCELRSRSYELARAFQVDARKVDGWKLFGVLAHSSSPASLTLGREDGVKSGDVFQVRGEDDERLAFFKVAQVGAGGPAGEKDHTLLEPLSGDAVTGARLEAYPQLGLVVAPYASFGLLTYCYGTTRIQSGDTFQDFTLPGVVFGGGATLGYEISSLVRWSNTYARVGGGIFTGSGLNTSALLVPIDLWFEKAFHVARRFSVAAAIGGTVQRSSVNVLTALDGVDEDLNVSSTMFGPAARLGADVMLHPDWSLKLEAAARVPMNSAAYTESDGKAIPAEWQSRDDHFATIAANLGIARTF
jgi:hypothetical protein